MIKKNTTPIIYIIDFDSTFIQVESLDELARLALQNRIDAEGIISTIQQITRLGMEGKIEFNESLERRLELLKPTKVQIEELTKELQKKITPSILNNKNFFKKNKHSIYIISGGFKEYIIPVVKNFFIEEEHVFANSLFFDSSGKVIGYDKKNPLAYSNGKVEKIRSLEFSSPVIMIGDGYTDYLVRKMGVVSAFYAFTENISRQEIVDKADMILPSFDGLLV